MEGPSWPKYVSLAALALAAGALLWHAADGSSSMAPGGEQAPRAPPRNDVETRRLRDRVGALETRVAQLERAGHAAAAESGAPASLPAAPEDLPPLRPPRPPESVEERRRQQEEQIAEADRQVANEPVDRAWAREATEQLRDAIRGSPRKAGASVEILSIDCRTTQCRVELRTAGDVALQFAGFGGWRSLGREPEGNDGVMVLYISRSDGTSPRAR